MNYLTNYYKNLSEQLEHKVRALESQARQLNEAVSTYNVYGAGVGDEYGRIPGDYNGDGKVDGADLGWALANGFNPKPSITGWTPNNRAPAGGGYRSNFRSGKGVNRGSFEGTGMGGGADSNIPGDYNGDGVVDGADLGLGLGAGYGARGTVANWGGGGAAPAFRSRAASVGSKAGGRGSFGAYGMGGGADSNIPGDYNGDGVVDGADLGLGLGAGYGARGTVANWSGGGVAPAMRRTSGTGKIGRGSYGDVGYGGGADQNIPGDFNGDGRVDGADLGLALGRGVSPGQVLNNWNLGDAGAGVPAPKKRRTY